jgi:hypothetical protein
VFWLLLGMAVWEDMVSERSQLGTKQADPERSITLLQGKNELFEGRKYLNSTDLTFQTRRIQTIQFIRLSS